MKKMLVLMSFLAVFTTMIFAGGPTCNVTGASGTKVELVNTSANSGPWGEVSVSLRLVNPDGYMVVNVMVYCYDAWGKPVDAISVTVSSKNGGKATFRNLEPNKAYRFEVDNATCK